VIALGSPSASWAKLVYFPERSVESVAVRVRKLAVLLDDLQVDIKNEDWDFIVEYPGQFRSYVPAFTKYTDAAYPDATAIDERYDPDEYTNSDIQVFSCLRVAFA